MKAFADWATSRRFRLWLLVILFLPLLVFMLPVAPALLALHALRNGPAEGLLGVFVTIGIVAAIGVLTGAPMSQAWILTGLLTLYLLPAGVGGALLSSTRSFSVAYQGTILGTMLAVFVLFAAFPAALQLGEMIGEAWMAMLSDGAFTSEQLQALAEVPPEGFVSLMLAPPFAVALVGLIAGFWLFAQIREGINFGSHFRSLRLGRFATIVLILAVTVCQLVPYVPLQLMAPLALVGFLFQGLAVLHARVRNENWPITVPIVVYALLCFPLTTVAVVLGLSAVGLLDNFFALRGRAAADD